jgi:hypothetical protein
MATISKRKPTKTSIMVFIYIKIRNEANTFDSKQIIFEAKQIHRIEQKLFSKRS